MKIGTDDGTVSIVHNLTHIPKLSPEPIHIDVFGKANQLALNH